MDNELKLCPFCGKTPDYRGTDAHADDCYLVVVKRSTSPNDINEAWEERPIEDALRAKVARLTLDLKGSENVNAYLNKQNIDIAKEIGELRAEVARLTAELGHALDNIEDYKALQDWAKSDYEKVQAELAAAQAEIRVLNAGLTGKVEELQLTREATCTWSYSEDWDGRIEWNGACGACWQFEDGGPVENEMAYCPTCGKRLVVMPTPPEQEATE